MDDNLIEILKCPVCAGSVFKKDDKIICVNCGKKYPIRDNIPIMLVEEAENG